MSSLKLLSLKLTYQKEVIPMNLLKMEFFQKRLTYVIFLKISSSQKVRVGRLGWLDFQKGTYIYVGSVKRGAKSRIKRHLQKKKILRWHIDYLTTLEFCTPSEIWIGNSSFECALAKEFTLHPSFISVKGFGSSDCRCRGHLFRVKRKKDLLKILTRKSFKPIFLI